MKAFEMLVTFVVSGQLGGVCTAGGAPASAHGCACQLRSPSRLRC